MKTELERIPAGVVVQRFRQEQSLRAVAAREVRHAAILGDGTGMETLALRTQCGLSRLLSLGGLGSGPPPPCLLPAGLEPHRSGRTRQSAKLRACARATCQDALTG